MGKCFWYVVLAIILIFLPIACGPKKDYQVICYNEYNEVTFEVKADTVEQFQEKNGFVIAGFYLGGEYFRHTVLPNEICTVQESKS